MLTSQDVISFKKCNSLPSGRIQLWGHAIAVDWAEPEVEVDEDTMATVKILYVRNLMLQTTEETIEKEFNSLKEGRGPVIGGVPQGSRLDPLTLSATR